MQKLCNVPTQYPLIGRERLCLSIIQAFGHTFTDDLLGKVNFGLPQLVGPSGALSHNGLLSCAYYGFVPLASSHRRFVSLTKPIYKRGGVTDSLSTDPHAREASAALEHGMSSGELKRFYKALDTLANTFGFESFASISNCEKDILEDGSPFAKVSRHVYASGPRYLWDVAKCVHAQNLSDFAFDTFAHWVLYLHKVNGVVFGHGLCPAAMRFGDFETNMFIDPEAIVQLPPFTSVIDVPLDVLGALNDFAAERFPDQRLVHVRPPLVIEDSVHAIPPEILAGPEGMRGAS